MPVLCRSCIDHCRNLRVRFVTEREIRSPAYRRDLRLALADLGISSHRYPEIVFDTFRDFPGVVVEGRGAGVALCEETMEHIDREWVRTVLEEPTVNMRLHERMIPRWQILATFFRVLDPYASAGLGLRAANDNAATPDPFPAVRGQAYRPCLQTNIGLWGDPFADNDNASV